MTEYILRLLNLNCYRVLRKMFFHWGFSAQEAENVRTAQTGPSAHNNETYDINKKILKSGLS
jgi:hypothetical protein